MFVNGILSDNSNFSFVILSNMERLQQAEVYVPLLLVKMSMFTNALLGHSNIKRFVDRWSRATYKVFRKALPTKEPQQQGNG